MECQASVVSFFSWALIILGLLLVLRQRQIQKGTLYGRYVTPGVQCVPARLGWSLQEVPAFLLPLLLLLLPGERRGGGGVGTVLLGAFMLHYFQRSFIYAYLTRGRPLPLHLAAIAAVFCSLNGFLQGHHLLHCGGSEHTWLTDAHVTAGLLLFVVGMIINLHSDHILRNLRKPGEVVYRIPRGGMFEFVSGANYFGEILEWFGFALAAWSLPSFAFAVFTACSIGPRALHHHRDYLQRFEDYPRSRTALVPFIL